MKDSIFKNAMLKVLHGLGALTVAWRRLTEPSAAVAKPEHRHQARLLMTILLVLFILGILAVTLSLLGVYYEPGEAKTTRPIFLLIMLITIFLFAVEYSLGRTIHYPLAAVLTIATLLGATFVAMVLNPQRVELLFFLVLGGLIGSLFFSARTTAVIFLVTFITLLLLSGVAPDVSTWRNMNALFFILTVGGLVVMATSLRQRYIEQIDWQTQQLVENEARLRELSIRDPLTGLFNRRYLEEVLALEMIRAVRDHYSIGIIMADIDYFKRFNDVHGHAAGDFVLVQVSNLLRTHVRLSDITCRYGGEEFVLILPEASREITLKRAEQIRDAVRNLHVQYEGQSFDAVTLSLGVAVFPDHGTTHDEILRAVDNALYQAKHAGRDRVMTATV